MTIANIREWGKGRLSALPPHTATVSILILSSTASFMLGVLSARDHTPVRVDIGQEVLSPEGEQVWIEGKGEDGVGKPVAPSALPAAAAAPLYGVPGQGFVASKNGSKYYLPTCGGASRIKEENKVWFATRADAEASGYEPAANCGGL